MNDWWVLNMMFIIMWCIFSFTWIVRIIWSCWITMVMLLVLYMLCAYMLLVNFLTCYLVLNRWCKHVMSNVGVDCWSCVNICIVVDWVICSCIITCWRILGIQLFGLIIRVVYDVQLASGVMTSKVIWYHMHIGVESRRIAWSWI